MDREKFMWNTVINVFEVDLYTEKVHWSLRYSYTKKILMGYIEKHRERVWEVRKNRDEGCMKENCLRVYLPGRRIEVSLYGRYLPKGKEHRPQCSQNYYSLNNNAVLW